MTAYDNNIINNHEKEEDTKTAPLSIIFDRQKYLRNKFDKTIGLFWGDGFVRSFIRLGYVIRVEIASGIYGRTVLGGGSGRFDVGHRIPSRSPKEHL